MDRWELLVAGAPFVQMAHAESAAEAGEVCVSREVWSLVERHVVGENATRRKQLTVLVKSVRRPFDPRPSPLRAADLADSPFAQIAKKMREHEQREARGDNQRMEQEQREAEQRQAEAAQQEAARLEAAAQLASSSPRSAQAVAVRTWRR